MLTAKKVKLIALTLVVAALASCAQPAPPEPMPPAPPPPPPPPPAPMLSPVPGTQEMSRLYMSGGAHVAAWPAPASGERYSPIVANPVRSTAEDRFSTFGVDVDTGGYANVRRFLSRAQQPPEDAVRVEEMVNYFRYDLPTPKDPGQPFSVTTDLAVTPWNPETRLLRIALRGYDLPRATRPPANLVFLVDVSGSMSDPLKLPLVQATLMLLADQLRPEDRVSIVTYSGQVRIALQPTNDRQTIAAAVATLRAEGSTAGGEALKMAYDLARAGRIDGGVNRIVLATDGDFNVGISDPKALKDFVAAQRKDGVSLTTLGFGEGNYSEAMLEGLADAGDGNYAYIDGVSEARKVLVEELASTLFTIAQDVKAQVEFNPAQVAEYRLIGYENRVLAREDFTNDKVDAGDIGAGHQVTALYEIALVGSKGLRLPESRYTPPPATSPPPMSSGISGNELGFLQLRYKRPGQTESSLIRQPIARPDAMALPQGDFAFAAAVAAFGQHLRGGKYLGAFSPADIARLAGRQTDYHRQEFIRLVEAAPAAR